MQALVVLEPERFEIQEVPVPEPGPMEVLCRVKAVSICGTDSHLIAGDYPGFWPPAFPIIPGHEWSGEIVKMGPGAEKAGWAIGDRVAGTSHDACGVCQQCVEGHYNLCENYGVMDLHRQYGHNYQGADADYVVHGVKCIFPLPDEISWEEGAVIDPAALALHCARRARIDPGDNVVIMGAGPVGLLGASAARAMGAGSVIVVGRGLRLREGARDGLRGHRQQRRRSGLDRTQDDCRPRCRSGPRSCRHAAHAAVGHGAPAQGRADRRGRHPQRGRGHRHARARAP